MNNIIITKYSDSDYSICVTDDIMDSFSGYSIRGTLTEVLEELDAESLNILKEVVNNIKLQEVDDDENDIWLRRADQRPTESFG